MVSGTVPGTYSRSLLSGVMDFGPPYREGEVSGLSEPLSEYQVYEVRNYSSTMVSVGL